MNTAAGQQQFHTQLAADTYDPDDVVPRGSPLMKAQRPRLALSPSPPPDISPAQVSSSPPPIVDNPQWSNRPKIRPSMGDAVLVTFLDNGRRPELAQAAAYHTLPAIDEPEDEESGREQQTQGQDDVDGGPPHHPKEDDVFSVKSRSCGSPPASSSDMNEPLSAFLQSMAADALQVASPDSRHVVASRNTLDITSFTRRLSLGDDWPTPNTFLLTKDSPDNSANSERLHTSPTAVPILSGRALAPLQMDSPKSESNGHFLPSLRSALGGDYITSQSPTPADKHNMVPRGSGSGASFSRSPTWTMTHCVPIPTTKISPPTSPKEAYQLSFPSPRSLCASSPYARQPYHALGQQRHTKCDTSSTSETPSTEKSAPTPATAPSVADRMSIDGITNPSVGQYVCKFEGCKAPPFQTQYLLKSHRNVHSSDRPHFCPVPDCPRSRGGTGFKRKNEMIRHGLCHESPGYICPFCPEREHRYPRPDNLQRHVRVHHATKDKDDPLLRQVLSQRPDGPNRGRRRRGGIGH